jgi:hypothetical protein
VEEEHGAPALVGHDEVLRLSVIVRALGSPDISVVRHVSVVRDGLLDMCRWARVLVGHGEALVPLLPDDNRTSPGRQHRVVRGHAASHVSFMADKQRDKGETKRRNGAQHADERTQRRAGEAQHGGESSQRTAERYASGEKPAGTHEGGAAVPREDPYEKTGLKRPAGDGKRRK